MANMDSDFEDDGNFPSNLDEFGQDFDESEFIESNILTLDDNRATASELQENIEDDGLSNITHSRNGSETPEKQVPSDGVLSSALTATGLSNLGRTAEGSSLTYLHLTLPGYSLRDISGLQQYVHLQKIELPHNELTDLSVLSCIPYLLELDVSHNQITSLLDFQPPRNLQTVNMSYNHIEELSDLSQHHYLCSLTLDNNRISEIKGLQNCHRLQNLSLAHNQISKIQGLENLPIKNLNLRSNQLKKIQGLETLKYLIMIDFSGNQIRSLEGLSGHEFLASIDMEGNEVIDLLEIEHIRRLALLRDLNLQRNPLRELPDYRLAVLFHLQQLTELDRRKVDTEEKVSAYNMFNPPQEVIAARDHIMHVVYSFLQPSHVLDSTLPNIETPYPMLVLVGPQGAGKKDLSHKLVEYFPDYFGLGVLHTTRPPEADEIDKKDYYFVTIDDFENDIKMGKFILTYNYNGHLYGMQMDVLESVARDSLACIAYMELEGVLSLKNSYFEPRYVLTLPMSREPHARRLQERALYSDSLIEWMIERTEMYAEYNRQHPGYFDMMINTDDITDAYYRLRRLVMEYLALGPSTPDMSEALDTPYTGASLYDRENTTDTMTLGSANMGARTWSKPSMTDSATQNIAVIRSKTISPVPPPSRGVVEEESIKRRRSAAKDAVAGHRPSIYEQLLSSTVPQPVSAQLGLQDKWRAHSAPVGNMDALPASSPDSSDAQSCVTSSLSNLSEAQMMTDTARPASLSGSIAGSAADVSQLDPVDPIQLYSGSTKSGSKTHSGGPMPPMPLTPRPGYEGGSRPTSGSGRPGSGSVRPSSGRPGSEKHPVLPPIGSPVEMLPES